jgi:hypothetical protein
MKKFKKSSTVVTTSIIILILCVFFGLSKIAYAAQGEVHSEGEINADLDLEAGTYYVTGTSETWELLAQDSYVKQIGVEGDLYRNGVHVDGRAIYKPNDTYVSCDTSNDYSGLRTKFELYTYGQATYSDDSVSTDDDYTYSYIGFDQA